MKLVYDKNLRTIKRRRPCGACNGRGYFDYYGDMLRCLRKNAGLSLREVARQLKLTPAYICDIELNRRGSTKRVMNYYQLLKVDKENKERTDA